MNTKNEKVIKSDTVQDAPSKFNHSRRAFAKTGLIAPVIMSLSSKTALGDTWDCTPSGLASGNNSSHQNRDPVQCPSAGNSVSTWCENAHKLDGSKGGCSDWYEAGVCPTDVDVYDRKTVTETRVWDKRKRTWGSPTSSQIEAPKRRNYQELKALKSDTDPSTVCDPVVRTWKKNPVAFSDSTSWSQWVSVNLTTQQRTKTYIYQKTTAKATLCKEILGEKASSNTCRDALLTGGMEAIAVANYLNCAKGIGPEGVTPTMIKELYTCYMNNSGFYRTASGLEITPAQCGAFLDAICPKV